MPAFGNASHSPCARPCVAMEANVRDAAVETLRLCREAGHDVSPAVAAVYVQAQRLAKVHPTDLVAHCFTKLASKGDPSLETLRMQVDVEATRALQAHYALELRNARELSAGALERTVSDTVVDAATVSGREERELLDKLHADAFAYVFVTHGLESVLENDLDGDLDAKDEAWSAMESVFPRHGARRFFTLPSGERSTALRELASVVIGALVFQRRSGSGTDFLDDNFNGRSHGTHTQLYDPFYETNGAVYESNPFFTKLVPADSLAKLSDQTGLFFKAVASTKNGLTQKLTSAERLCGQYAVVVEHLGASNTPSQDPTLRRLTDELNNRRAYADALRNLVEECERSTQTVFALNQSLTGEITSVEIALDNLNQPNKTVRFEGHGGDTLVTRKDPLSKRNCYTNSAGVPAAVAFPALDAIGALHVTIEEEILNLKDVRAVEGVLVKHAKPFTTTLTNGMLHSATEAYRRAHAREIPMEQPKFEHDRHTPDRVYDDSLCRAMAIKESAEIVPGNTVAFANLALGGYDAHAVVKRGGVLRRARVGDENAARTVWGDLEHVDPKKIDPGDAVPIANTAVIFHGKAYGFSDEDGALQFASQPSVYLKKLERIASVRPELLHALRLENVVHISNVIAETTAELFVSALHSGGHPQQQHDFGAQTPTHFVERHKDPTYEWNTWALKRRALRMANLRNNKTKSAQTGLSHFRRAGQTQTWAPKANESQTLVEKATAMPKKVRYVGGLRGAPAEAKMHVVSLELDLGQPHEF